MFCVSCIHSPGTSLFSAAFYIAGTNRTSWYLVQSTRYLVPGHKIVPLNHDLVPIERPRVHVPECHTDSILFDFRIFSPLYGKIHDVINIYGIILGRTSSCSKHDLLTHILRQHGTKVAVILATDGFSTCNESTKRYLVNALKSLEGLPVWLIIRLCTNEEDVVEFYNSLDSQLESSLEVLDEFMEETKEVYEHNKWLNYALPLHRCREMD